MPEDLQDRLPQQKDQEIAIVGLDVILVNAITGLITDIIEDVFLGR